MLIRGPKYTHTFAHERTPTHPHSRDHWEPGSPITPTQNELQRIVDLLNQINLRRTARVFREDARALAAVHRGPCEAAFAVVLVLLVDRADVPALAVADVRPCGMGEQVSTVSTVSTQGDTDRYNQVSLAMRFGDDCPEIACDLDTFPKHRRVC